MDYFEYLAEFEVFYFFVWCIIMFVIFSVFSITFRSVVDSCRINRHRKNFKINVIKYESSRPKYRDLDASKLALLNNPNLNDLKDYFYDIFFQFETAYNRVDYGMLRNLATPKLYQNFHLLISLDLKKGNKKVIDNIKRENIIIYDVMSSSYSQTIFALIEVSYISYTINKNGYVISGDRNNRINECFEVMFKKSLDKEEVVKCPNCGAHVVNNKCEYCRTVIKDEEYKIHSIQRVIK